jgi:hypothetical protein
MICPIILLIDLWLFNQIVFDFFSHTIYMPRDNYIEATLNSFFVLKLKVLRKKKVFIENRHVHKYVKKEP